MHKLLLSIMVGGAVLLTSWDGGPLPRVSQADARIGRPLTPFSVAGVHRRVMRRNFGVGWRAPVAAAAIGAVATGVGAVGYYADPRVDYSGGWGGGCSCPSYGGGYGGWGAPGVGGWGSGLGWRPGIGVGAPGFGWHRGWDRGWHGGWGW
jgi:hypothetical protein